MNFISCTLNKVVAIENQEERLFLVFHDPLFMSERIFSTMIIPALFRFYL